MRPARGLRGSACGCPTTRGRVTVRHGVDYSQGRSHGEGFGVAGGERQQRARRCSMLSSARAGCPTARPSRGGSVRPLRETTCLRMPRRRLLEVPAPRKPRDGLPGPADVTPPPMLRIVPPAHTEHVGANLRPWAARRRELQALGVQLSRRFRIPRSRLPRLRALSPHQFSRAAKAARIADCDRASACRPKLC